MFIVLVFLNKKGGGGIPKLLNFRIFVVDFFFLDFWTLKIAPHDMKS